ncbi:MAG: hypothetical protein JWM52_601 [Candidatus Saccharibacteria bacterium]|nr:hypothetical protein [Candidatus Saccharibacteria bacterium]
MLHVVDDDLVTYEFALKVPLTARIDVGEADCAVSVDPFTVFAVNFTESTQSAWRPVKVDNQHDIVIQLDVDFSPWRVEVEPNDE